MDETSQNIQPGGNAERRRKQRAAQHAAARRRRRNQRRLRDKAHQPHPLRLYRVGRLAELFDVDRATIWRWRKSGVLPLFVKIGGIEGLTEQQVQKLLEQRPQDVGDA